MATAAVTTTFVDATTAVAAEVNENFTDLVNFLNASVIHADASIAFSSIPTLPASSPTTDNQATRKKYVDDADAVVAATVTALNTELDTKASRQALRDTMTGGADTLLVASGAYSTWTTTNLSGSVDEVDGHRYLYMCHFPELHTNKTATAFGFVAPPTRVALRVRRAGAVVGKGFVDHYIENKGNSVTIVDTYLASATASVTWDVQAAHFYDENNGGADAQIRYSGDATFPAHLTVVDLGLHF